MRGARLRVRAAARHVPPAHHHPALAGRVPPHPGLFATVPRRLPREVLLMHRPLRTDLPAAIVYLLICDRYLLQWYITEQILLRIYMS